MTRSNPDIRDVFLRRDDRDDVEAFLSSQVALRNAILGRAAEAGVRISSDYAEYFRLLASVSTMTEAVARAGEFSRRQFRNSADDIAEASGLVWRQVMRSGGENDE